VRDLESECQHFKSVVAQKELYIDGLEAENARLAIQINAITDT